MSETWEESAPHKNQLEGTPSLPRRPLSRRALVKAAGIAPLLALAKEAWAAPTPGIMAAVAGLTPISETELTWAVGEAKKARPNIDQGKFELVARLLWTHFQYGIGNVCVKKDMKLLELMYNDPVSGTSGMVKTGDRIAENVDLGNFDPFGNDYQTNHCAYLCGHKAAMAAVAQGPSKEIDEDIYKQARADTQAEVSKKLDAACKERSKKTGFGC